jgi:hypothetical protein
MRERKKKKKNISLAASGEILEFSNFASKIWSLNGVSQINEIVTYYLETKFFYKKKKLIMVTFFF